SLSLSKGPAQTRVPEPAGSLSPTGP
ncbi:MAG: hypothetical protein RI885_1304, partial [Actinomycetota bacterium]